MIFKMLLFSKRFYRYENLIVFSLPEFNLTILQCEKGVVAADSYVQTRIMFRSPLAYNYIARFGHLTSEELDSKSLAF